MKLIQIVVGGRKGAECRGEEFFPSSEIYPAGGGWRERGRRWMD